MKSINLRKQENSVPGSNALLAIVVAFCFSHTQSFAQMKVGLNPTTINAGSVLELESSNQGVLLPRVSLDPVITVWGLAGSSTNGMFVFNLNASTGTTGIGVYYWANSKWNYVQNGAAANTGWLITGNAGTNPGTYPTGTNFIGTTDGVDFAVRTTNAERMRISAAGQIGINQNFLATQQLAVTTGVAANTAVVGQNTTASNTSTGIGVLGTTLQSGGYGVKGTNGNVGGIAILGQNTVASGTGGNGIGVEGISAQSYNVGPPITNGYGVVALNSNANGTGLYAGGNNVGLNYALIGGGSGGAFAGTNIGGFGYSSAGAGYGLYGYNAGASGRGVYGVNDNTTAFQMGVYGTYNTGWYGTGVIGIGDNGTAIASASTIDVGVYGSANNYGVYGYSTTAGYGVYGKNSNSDGTGIYGEVTNVGTNLNYPVAIIGNASAISGTGRADGVDGFTNQQNGAGVFGINAYRNTGATGVYGSQKSNAIAPLTLRPTLGSGGAFTGNGIDVPNNVIIGVAGFANYGISTAGNSSSIYAGGYFATQITQSSPYAASTYAYVGVQWGGTTYKIVGTGGVSTIVNDLKNDKVNLFAPEAPEMLFEDYGKGKLVNGKVHIDLDLIFTKNITVNDKHPLRVFIQLNGDCEGVYVINNNSHGFDVIELKGGKSNVQFQWHVIGNRADEYDSNGLLSSKNADLRFPTGPGPMELKNTSTKVIELKTSKIINQSGAELIDEKENILNPALKIITKDKVSEDKKQRTPAPPAKKD